MEINSDVSPPKNEQNEMNQIVELGYDSLWGLSHASNLLLHNNHLIYC